MFSRPAWNPEGTMIATGSADGMLSLFYGWSETSARAYLDTIMTSDEMDALVRMRVRPDLVFYRVIL